MRLSSLALLCSCSLLALTGCPNDDDDDGGDVGVMDSGSTDSGGLDAKPDAGDFDSGEPDTGDDADAGGMDAGDSGIEPPEMALFPGMGVTFGSRIDIGTDTFASVNTKLAGATRTRSAQENARSYEYTIAGTAITIWFANSNLDGDDAAPNDVDDADAVLWIAVQDGFTGTTPDGLGLDSTRAEIEGVYGTPPHTVEVMNPAGTLAQYYTRGLLVAYDPNDEVRTITISRAYGTEPDGEIDPPEAAVTFMGGELRGFVDIGNLGTERQDVLDLLGMPDVEETTMISGQTLDTLSYGFLGVEVFFAEGGMRALFFVLHPPFYGTTAGGLGMGSTRTDFEAYLATEGYSPMASSNPQLVCYDSGDPPMVGVTYTAADDLVSSITLPLLQCP